MLLPILFLLGGILLLYLGAEGLVRGSAAVARRLGLTPLVIGLTVVAFGTSMPELVVSVGATLEGRGPIAIGNVVGSNIGNIALILGLAALIQPLKIHAQLLKLDMPVLLVVSAVFVAIIYDGQVNRLEGALLLAGLLGYTTFSLWLARAESRAVQAEFAEGSPKSPGALWLDLVCIGAGLGALVAGARLLVSGAVEIAEAVGLSEAVIALTIVAIGTSLPELATSMLAALRGHGDIAVGNIVGSNLFNILGIVGVASLVRPIGETGMSGVDLAVMVGVTIVLLPLMWTGSRLSRGEGAFLLLSYSAYVIYLVV